jgi:hypothetical protein
VNPSDWEAVREAVGFITSELEDGNKIRRREVEVLERLAVAVEVSNERLGEVVDALVALGVTLEGRS